MTTLWTRHTPEGLAGVGGHQPPWGRHLGCKQMVMRRQMGQVPSSSSGTCSIPAQSQDIRLFSEPTQTEMPSQQGMLMLNLWAMFWCLRQEGCFQARELQQISSTHLLPPSVPGHLIMAFPRANTHRLQAQSHHPAPITISNKHPCLELGLSTKVKIPPLAAGEVLNYQAPSCKVSAGGL